MKKLLVVFALLVCAAAVEKPEDYCWSITAIDDTVYISEKAYMDDSFNDFDTGTSSYIHDGSSLKSRTPLCT